MIDYGDEAYEFLSSRGIGTPNDVRALAAFLRDFKQRHESTLDRLLRRLGGGRNTTSASPKGEP